MRILGHRQRDIDIGTTRLDYPRLRERRQVIRRIDTVEKLERVHPSNNVLKALDVVCAQYLDKSVETLKADRSNLVNHDAVSVPVACHLEPEWPWPDPARQRTDYRHVGLVHGVRADHDARAPFLLFVSSPRRIEINPINAKPDNLLNSQFE